MVASYMALGLVLFTIRGDSVMSGNGGNHKGGGQGGGGGGKDGK